MRVFVGLGRKRVEPCVQRNSTTGSFVSPVSGGVPSSMLEFLSTYYINIKNVNLDFPGCGQWSTRECVVLLVRHDS